MSNLGFRAYGRLLSAPSRTLMVVAGLLLDAKDAPVRSVVVGIVDQVTDEG